MLRPHQKTIILSVVSQVPMLLLLIIFFHIPGLPLLYRVMATITILLEAAILSELIGNIVQRVRADDESIIVRGVFEREKIPWNKVKGVRQVILSPLRRSDIKSPSKLFLVKMDDDHDLLLADQWWIKKGPLAHKQSGLAQLVEKYNAHIMKELRGWFILWAIDYHQPQECTDTVKEKYLVVDDREKSVIHDLKTFSDNKTKNINFVDMTYPSYVKNYGGKYAKDTEHVWETIE